MPPPSLLAYVGAATGLCGLVSAICALYLYRKVIGPQALKDHEIKESIRASCSEIMAKLEAESAERKARIEAEAATRRAEFDKLAVSRQGEAERAGAASARLEELFKSAGERTAEAINRVAEAVREQNRDHKALEKQTMENSQQISSLTGRVGDLVDMMGTFATRAGVDDLTQLRRSRRRDDPKG